MADKKLNIKVGLKGHKKAEKGLTKVDNSMKNMAKSAIKLGTAFFAARGMIMGMTNAIELAKIQEVAERKLATALGYTSQALLDQARALQKVSTFGDEAIIGVQASIAAFIDSEEQIKKATAATLDLATGMGLDLKSAGDLIAKTLGSSTNAMSRYGIEVEGAVGSSKRLDSLVESVADKFGGMAEAISETTTGQLEQIKGEWSDAMEGIGEGMLVAFDGKIRGVNDIMQEMGDIGWDVVGETMIGNWQDILSVMTRATVLSAGAITAELRIMLMESLSGGFIDTFAGLIGESTTETAERLREDQAKVGEMIAQMMQEMAERMRERAAELKTERDSLEKEDKPEEKKKKKIKLTKDETDAEKKLREEKEKQIITDLKSAAISGQTAIQSMKSVVRAETMEAVAGYLASILKTVPFPANLLLAAGAGGLVAGMMDKALSAVPNKFAQGGIVPGQGTGDTVPAMLTPGEVILNQAQQENLVGGMGVTINIQGGIVQEDYVRNELIPALNKATSLGARINA